VFSFAWWWAICLLPMPLLSRYWLRPVPQRNQVALKVPFYNALLDAARVGQSTKRWALLVAALMWCLLVIATMRPQWLGDPIDTPLAGRDILLGIDISGSMRERDFEIGGQRVQRLEAAKAVASTFIERRQGDRIGIVLFGDRAQVQIPLTYDRKTVQVFLSEAATGLLGASTAIGDAIGMAVKRLRERPAQSRVMILLTDGANTAGTVSPQEAVQIAADNNIRIYTIGIGAEAGLVRGFYDQWIKSSQSLDEQLLQHISQVTGGRYFRAVNTDELMQIYQLIDTLEPTDVKASVLRPRIELFQWPLALSLLCSTVLFWLRVRY